MTRLPELEARLDALTTDILLPLRASKEVNSEAIKRLYELADDLATEIGGSDVVPRLLTGKLWFVFTQMLSEADHTRSPDDILMSVWAYEDRLEKIFWSFLLILASHSRRAAVLVGVARPWRTHGADQSPDQVDHRRLRCLT